MTGRTHLAAGMVAGLVAASVAGINPGPAGLIGGLAALGPDIDTFNSKAGRAIPILPLIPWPGGHRGFTHSLPAVALVSAGVGAFLGPDVALAVAAGWGSHILLDILNPEGAQVLWPLRRMSITRRFPGKVIWRTGGMLDWALRYALFFSLGVFLWQGKI